MGGILMCSIASIFIRLLGNAENHSMLLDGNLLKAFVRFVISNPPKALPNDIFADNKTYWDYALNQCLQCLAALTVAPDPDVSGIITWKEIISGAECSFSQKDKKLSDRFQKLSQEMARKRPVSQSTSFLSCLKFFISERSDPCRSIASKQIVERLEA